MEMNPNDYLKSFLAALQKNEKAKKELEALLLEGINSPTIVADEAFWRERRKKIFDKRPELESEGTTSSRTTDL